jgi:hypothetical protein
MPDEDLSQQAAPPIDVSTPPSPIEDAPQPTPLEPTPPESAPMPDAPVADTPVETEPPVEVPVENPIVEPISPAPVESAPVSDSLAPVMVQTSGTTAPIAITPPPIVTTPDHSSSAYLKSLNPLSLASRMRHRNGRKERLLAHVAEKGHVTRRDAQLLLEVSGATADRYLRELASEGRIVKESDGRYTKYKFVA